MARASDEQRPHLRGTSQAHLRRRAQPQTEATIWLVRSGRALRLRPMSLLTSPSIDATASCRCGVRYGVVPDADVVPTSPAPVKLLRGRPGPCANVAATHVLATVPRAHPPRSPAKLTPAITNCIGARPVSRCPAGFSGSGSCWVRTALVPLPALAKSSMDASIAAMSWHGANTRVDCSEGFMSSYAQRFGLGAQAHRARLARDAAVPSRTAFAKPCSSWRAPQEACGRRSAPAPARAGPSARNSQNKHYTV
jgi:hypothetical protein